MSPEWHIPFQVWSILVFSIAIPVACGIAGGAIQSWLAHQFAEERENVARQYAAAIEIERRRTNFLAFMDRWKSEVEDCGIPEKQSIEWEKKKPLFIYEASLVKRDFGDRKRFGELRDAISFAGHHAGQIGQTDAQMNFELIGRANLVKAIDALIAFAEAN
jgi:hypothetical protein